MTATWGVEREVREPIGERWRAVSLKWKVVIVLVAAFVAGQAVLGIVGGIVGGSSSGPEPSSSYDTSPVGTAALAQLLGDRGHPIVRSSVPIDQQSIPAGSTLFVIDPTSWSQAESGAVVSLLRNGGRVVVAGQPPAAGLVSAMFGATDPPTWSSDGPGARAGTATVIPAGDSPMTAGVSRIDISILPLGSVTPTSSAPAILVGPQGTFAVAGTADSGARDDAVFLASSAPLLNGGLGRADNAALAIDLAGAPTSTVVFDEFDLGAGGGATGLAGLPAHWRWALIVGLLAVVIWLLSAARRFGPVEPVQRLRIPPRIAYAESMATVLATLPRERRVEAVDSIIREGRVLLCRRAGVPISAGDEAVSDAATAVGIPFHVIGPILDPVRADLVSTGRAFAWLESSTGGNP